MKKFIFIPLLTLSLIIFAKNKRNPFCYQQPSDRVVAEGYIQGRDIKIVLVHQDGSQVIKKIVK